MLSAGSVFPFSGSCIQEEVRMGNKVENTVYDNVFGTMLHDCTRLIIPVVNEVFGEDYSGDEEIMFLHNEHYVLQPEGNTKEKITDTSFRICGKVNKNYHIECQSTADSSMIMRMFEYDAQIALDEGEVDGERFIVTFPKSAVLYLRHTRNTPEEMIVEIRTPGGNVSYGIPVMKTQKYTIEEIFEKKLLFLLPFYIFVHEKHFGDYEKNEEYLLKLQEETAGICRRLSELVQKGEISEFVRQSLMAMMKEVAEKIAEKYEKVRRGVTSAMGGEILEYEAKTIWKGGYAEGERSGFAEGKRSGFAEGEIKAYIDLIRDGIFTVSEAARRLDMKEEELETYLKDADAVKQDNR